MSKHSPTPSYSLLSFVCATFGHNYTVSRTITNYINEYKCSHCGKEVTENFQGKIELLTRKVKEANSSLASLYQRKSQKISA